MVFVLAGYAKEPEKPKENEPLQSHGHENAGSSPELVSINAKIQRLEKLIFQADNQIASYQSQNTPNQKTLIDGAKAAKAGYEAQKKSLVDRRQQLLKELPTTNQK
jgi:hypothetical protein